VLRLLSLGLDVLPRVIEGLGDLKLQVSRQLFQISSCLSQIGENRFAVSSITVPSISLKRDAKPILTIAHTLRKYVYWGGESIQVVSIPSEVIGELALGRVPATWLVNSATHLHGGRRFATRDESRNSWWVALLTGGEGWHNNHHANPVSARHRLAWYEFDPNYYGIWLLERLRLAKHIRIAKLTGRGPDPTLSRKTHMSTS